MTDLNKNGIISDGDRFVEIWNKAGSTQDLAGWKLRFITSVTTTYTLPGANMAADARLAIWRDPLSIYIPVRAKVQLITPHGVVASEKWYTNMTDDPSGWLYIPVGYSGYVDAYGVWFVTDDPTPGH